MSVAAADEKAYRSATMDQHDVARRLDRRDFLKTAGAGDAAGAPAAAVPPVPANRDQTTGAQMKQRYGEITMLDFPQWTKDNFPGVTRMDLFSGLFGDVSEDSMFMTSAD